MKIFYSIKNDDRTVWINGKSSILGRFCPLSQEIFNPKVSVSNSENTYLYHKIHEKMKPRKNDWEDFCNLMKQKFDIDIPVKYTPKYVLQ